MPLIMGSLQIENVGFHEGVKPGCEHLGKIRIENQKFNPQTCKSVNQTKDKLLVEDGCFYHCFSPL